MASRAKIIMKLTFLVGLPVAFLFAIFTSGIYCGVQNQHTVLSFEHDVLGMDVEVPPEDGEEKDGKDGDGKDDEDGKDEKGEKDEKDDGGEKDDGDDGDDKPSKPDPVPEPRPDPTPVADPEPRPDPTPVADPARMPVALPEPVDDAELQRALSSVRTVKVKVLVDRDLVAQRPDWIEYSTRLVAAASGSYKNLFGIELRLTGVVEWDVAAAALGRNQMNDDLAKRPREGADLVLALTARSLDGDADVAAVAEGEQNGGHAVIFADTRAKAPHLRPMLRQLGHLFGAPAVTDVQSDAYQRGSWMSQAPVPEGSAPWVDAQSRRTILERKDNPISEQL